MTTSLQIDLSMISNETSWWDIKKHVTYHAIETTSSTKRVEMFANDKLLDKCEWVVTEKIHGSNFSFVTNGKQVICANRARPLSDSEVYYGFQTVKEKYSSNILKLWQIMSSKGLIQSSLNTTEKVVIIFGELFGGRYSHPDVKPVESALMCQYGIEYCPQNEFMAFDIYDGRDYLNYDIMIELLEESGLPFLKPLFRGSYEEACKYDPEFITPIPSLFGLPPLSFRNKSEGVIIKPVLTLRTFIRRKRVILKIKSSDFVERVRSKKHEFKLMTRNEQLKQRETESESMIELMGELVTFINENRVNSVVSKFGPVVPQKQEGEVINQDERIQQVAKLLSEDALTDFNKDDNLKEKFDKLATWKQEIVKRRGNSEALKVVKEYVEKVKSILDNSSNYINNDNNNNNNNNNNNSSNNNDILPESGDDEDFRWATDFIMIE